MHHRVHQAAAYAALLILAVWGPSECSYAEAEWSTASLKVTCLSDESTAQLACKAFLHGVVETWMTRDVVSVSPYKYASHKKPVFCEMIQNVSEDEWVRIVRAALLKNTDSSFAAPFVMEALDRQLCSR